MRYYYRMRYTISQFKTDYPDSDTCLNYIFNYRYGDLLFCPKCAAETKFYKVKKRSCYACKHCGYQISPLAQTIFHKSSTSLWCWFYAIYLFSVAKNGISAKELERHLGVTYKTAWRMSKQIRLLMAQDSSMLNGIVEVDETFYGKDIKGGRWPNGKKAVVGIVERKGSAKAIVAPADATTALSLIKDSIEPGSKIYTDESRIYSRVKRDFIHQFITHNKREFARGPVHTNTIEGFWSQLKRSIYGTYHSVSPKYLQSYVNQFVFLYNYRDDLVFERILILAVQPI